MTAPPSYARHDHARDLVEATLVMRKPELSVMSVTSHSLDLAVAQVDLKYPRVTCATACSGLQSSVPFLRRDGRVYRGPFSGPGVVK
jgi:hypothetical protein